MSENTVVQSEENVIIATFNVTSENTTITLKKLIGMTQIDWGDGIINSELSHTFVNVGEYICKIYNVTEIGSYAFKSCSSLTSVVIPDSVTSIGYGAFTGCGSLTSIEIPDSVTSIGGYAFYGCSSLTSVVIGDGVTSIGYGVFSTCSKLVEIKISENNTVYQSIDGNLYSKDGTVLIQYAIGKTATEFVIPDSVTTIGSSAFSSCDSLTSVVIGDSVATIDGYAFSDCSGLTSIDIPDSVTVINDHAFSDCSGLTSAVIPDSVTVIEQSAFWSCSNLTEIVIPNSVTSIGMSAFRYCSSLTSVVIPESVTSIGNGAFADCSSLMEIVLEGGLEYTGHEIFLNCINLMSVTASSQLSSFGYKMFDGCNNLKTVYLKRHVPYPPLDKMFNYADNPDLIFYVPESSLETYRVAWDGKIVADRIQPYDYGLFIALDGLRTYHITLKERYLNSMATQDWVKQYIVDNFATLMADYLNSAEATENKPTTADISEVFNENEEA